MESAPAIDDDGELENLVNEFAMFVKNKKFYKSKFHPAGTSSHTRRPPAERPRIAPAVDKSEVTCYNCNRKGHFASECRSKKAVPSSSNPAGGETIEEKYNKLKSFTKRLMDEKKALQNKTPTADKGLVAEVFDWAESGSDSDEEEEDYSLLCLMARVEDGITGEDASPFQWVNIVHKKVCSLKTANEVDARDTLDSIMCDLTFIDQIKSETLGKLKSALNENIFLKEQLKEVEPLKDQLAEKDFITSILQKEFNDKNRELAAIKKICESWTRSSKLVEQCVSQQIPNQVKAVIGGDFFTAAAISDSTNIDPIFKAPAGCAQPSKEETADGVRVNRFVKSEKTYATEMLPLVETVSVKTEQAELDDNLADQPKTADVASTSKVQKQKNILNAPTPKKILNTAHNKVSPRAGLGSKNVKHILQNPNNSKKNMSNPQFAKGVPAVKQLESQLNQLTSMVKKIAVSSNSKLSGKTEQAVSSAPPHARKRKYYKCGSRGHNADDCMSSSSRPSPPPADVSNSKRKSKESEQLKIATHTPQKWVVKTKPIEPTKEWVPKNV